MAEASGSGGRIGVPDGGGGKGRRRDTRGWVSTLLSYAGRCRGKMAASVLLSLLSVGAGLVPYYAIYRVLDVVLLGGGWDGVVPWLVVAVVAHVATRLLFAGSTLLSHISAYTILADLRYDVARKLMRASLGTATSKGVGSLKNLLVDRIESIEVPLAHMIPELTGNLLLSLGILAWLWAVDWRMALACAATVPVGFLVFASGFASYNRMYAGYMEASDHVNSVMVEYIEGIRVVKAFNQTSGSYRRYADAVRAFRDYTLGWFKATWVTQNLALAVIPTTLLGVVPAGLALYLEGSLDAAQFALCCVLALAVVMPVTYLGASFNVANNVSYAIADAREFLDLPELPQPSVRADVRGRGLVLEGVRFSYGEGRDEVLHGVDLEVGEGEFLALVGPSGSGKSTIARLVARHWDVTAGSVRIGGRDVRDMPLDQLSELVSYVSQDDYLLAGTLLDNVRLGRPGATDEEVLAAARAASCEEFVSRLPQGWQTPAGEAGHALSGGERQRICIARAILKDAPIVVFDEATAFADPQNEARIQVSVARLARGKTLVVIAHRLSTITGADQIAVVSEGAIVARGTHEQLLEGCELYRGMWQAHVGASSWAAGSRGAAGASEASDKKGDDRSC